VKKQQLLLLSGGVILFCLIYFFGQTIPPKKKSTVVSATDADTRSILDASKSNLTPSQQAQLNQLETGIVRGDIKDQQIKVYRQIAAFWRDTAHLLLPYSYYTAEAAKLENSEKSLTFAAQQFFGAFPNQENPDLKKWMALQAKELFERVLKLNPNNDSARIQIGSCYLFGNISETPMEGIRMIREVAEKDPQNMYAQHMLGMGAVYSGQFDKAIERFLMVAKKEPGNIEAKLLLAESYERTGDTSNAIKWYQESLQLVKQKEFAKEIEKRINSLRTN